ncbi:hypothetical protein VTG60DRAFT_2681 [Thermothelomyces hinnuleus]
MPPPTTAGSVHPNGPQMIEMDVDGDLVLRVGSELGKAQDFRVCSATMRRASPIWKAMLFGPWKEAKPTEGNWRVDLPDDNPWPTSILLAIIHSKFRPVQRVKSLGEMHEILLVADKSWGPSGGANGSGSRSSALPAQATAVAQSADVVIHALSAVFARVRSLHPDRKSCNPSLAYQDLLATIKVQKRRGDVLEAHHKERLAAQRMKMSLGAS